ncbi:bifunctional (p)ppGpp synthetase/guanosine-3',5'-bis(diphosphate) 3'-pyrophosphohydrolase [Thioalkalicoccus limnaeus]|uniref:guanosine-3',5'-bis(diphosphate) 3'-diphosphatase n=1 Tax=Thioalkalicoccus limnaeus TaxID=120681 RepID=A0ABV4BA41_9GAMM
MVTNPPPVALNTTDPTLCDLGSERYIADLCLYLETYLPREQIHEVYAAYLFSAEAHQGQRRKSGEPYIRHPIAVARILAEMRMDHKGLMAALMHDVIEDTPVAKEDLASRFGSEIADLVDGVSKVTQIDCKSRIEVQAASFRRIVLAMTRDVRVILIKLADRLHNMRTIGAMPPESRRRISRETLEIYAPIAYRLGLSRLQIELEELGFANHWPWRYRVLRRALEQERDEAVALVNQVERAILARLDHEAIAAEAVRRHEHVYRVFRKKREHRRPFRELLDTQSFRIALRIIVDRVDTCYRVLGLVHGLYKPRPAGFADHIAIPKSNGYQSLHTILLGPGGSSIEIQIRTREMQRNAEFGIAAHWLDRNEPGDSGPLALSADWLRNLLDVSRGSGESEEFLDQVKVDLVPDEILVFTPKGEPVILPKGSSVVDFAYAIHSDIGHTCVGAKINRRLAALNTVLRAGQTIEIITAPGNKPHPSWMRFVVTGKARTSIRAYLKNLRHREAQDLGRRLLDAELATYALEFESVDPGRLATYLDEAELNEVSDLFAEIALGNRSPALVAYCLAAVPDEAQVSVPRRLAIKGTEGVALKYARCCRPIPGDAIVGLFHPGRGIFVHRRECGHLGDHVRQRGRCLDLDWAESNEAEYTTQIRVDMVDRPGALATVASVIAEMRSNIENIQSLERDGMITTLEFLINVRGRQHLARILRRVRRIAAVVRTGRVTHGGPSRRVAGGGQQD